MNLDSVLSQIPSGLRDPLLKEYNSIVQHYLERRWTASELSGGKFCEIVYTILDGYANNSYPSAPSKPSNFVDACRRLENNTNVPRSFQILIPRILPSLYEIRNNRNVGHVGGDVNPNFMDSNAVIAMSGWIMGELIRVYHNISVAEAQKLVDFITNRKIPFIWQSNDIKRILDPKIKLKNQILLLISSNPNKTKVEDLLRWTETKNKSYFKKILLQLHSARMIELSESENLAEILPPGIDLVERLIIDLNP